MSCQDSFTLLCTWFHAALLSQNLQLHYGTFTWEDGACTGPASWPACAWLLSCTAGDGPSSGDLPFQQEWPADSTGAIPPVGPCCLPCQQDSELTNARNFSLSWPQARREPSLHSATHCLLLPLKSCRGLPTPVHVPAGRRQCPRQRGQMTCRFFILTHSSGACRGPDWTQACWHNGAIPTSCHSQVRHCRSLLDPGVLACVCTFLAPPISTRNGRQGRVPWALAAWMPCVGTSLPELPLAHAS